MEQENMPVDSVDAPQADSTVQSPSVGQLLREARERAGMSVEEVVGKIKLASRQIEALEADDFESLPETAFVRGFVRSYAKLLEIDAQPLLDALPGAKAVQVKEDPLHVEAPFPTAKTMRRQSVNLLIAAFLVVLAIAGFALWQSSTPEPVAQVQSAQDAADEALVEMSLPLSAQLEVMEGSVAPESAVPDAAMQAAVSPSSDTAQPASALRLVFDRESWAEIKDKTGRTLSRQVNPPGSELRLQGIAPFELVIGHATAVRLYLRDKPVDLSSYINASSDVARLTLE